VIGEMLGHYQITEKPGRAAMGEACRTENSNLSQPVAIKVSHHASADDQEWPAARA
jgi:hypothetical protein